MADLAAWGFNVVRLGVMWQAVEPVRGQYNTTYLGIMRGISDRLGAHGIYTIVDMHQDVMNPKFCGEGFPDWASTSTSFLKFPLPLPFEIPTDPTTGYPNVTVCNQHAFAMYYLSAAVSSAVGNFYASQDLTDAFASYWQQVATVFANSSWVLGYELLNEPWSGDVLSHPTLLLPGEADKKNLAPLYAKVHKAIRQVDSSHIIFYEPAVVETDAMMHSGFESGPGGPEFNDRQAYAYHIYCPVQNGSGDPTQPWICTGLQGQDWKVITEDRQKLGGGHFLTEFGALGPNEASVDQLHNMLWIAEANNASWAYWTFKSFHDITTTNAVTEGFYNSDGSLQTGKVKALSRTYATAVAGALSVSAFDPDSAVYTLSFVPSTNTTATTEIFMHTEFYYPNGYNVVISPPQSASSALSAPHTLTVTTLTPAVPLITVKISPK